MKKTAMLMAAVLLCAAVCYGQTRPIKPISDNDFLLQGMCRIGLNDGRMFNGAVKIELSMLTATWEGQAYNIIDRMVLQVEAEPSMINFLKESAFNQEGSRMIEMGLSDTQHSGVKKTTGSIIIPGWGSLSIIGTKRIKSTEWMVGEGRVRIMGTTSGFEMLISQH